MALEGISQNTRNRDDDTRLRRDVAHSRSDRNAQPIPVLFRLKNLNSPPLSDAEKAAQALESVVVAKSGAGQLSAVATANKTHLSSGAQSNANSVSAQATPHFKSDKTKSVRSGTGETASASEQKTTETVHRSNAEEIVIKTTSKPGFKKVFLVGLIGVLGYFAFVNKRTSTDTVAKNTQLETSAEADVHAAKVIASATKPLAAPTLPTLQDEASSLVIDPNDSWSNSTNDGNSIAVESAMQAPSDWNQNSSQSSTAQTSSAADSALTNNDLQLNESASGFPSVSSPDFNGSATAINDANGRPFMPNAAAGSSSVSGTDSNFANDRNSLSQDAVIDNSAMLLPNQKMIENPWTKQAEPNNTKPASVARTSSPSFVATDAPEIYTNQLYEMLTAYQSQPVAPQGAIQTQPSMQLSSGPVSQPINNATYPAGVVAPQRQGYGLPPGYAPVQNQPSQNQPSQVSSGQTSTNPLGPNASLNSVSNFAGDGSSQPRPYTPIYTEFADAPPEASLNRNTYPDRTGIAPKPSIPYQPISPTFQP